MSSRSGERGRAPTSFIALTNVNGTMACTLARTGCERERRGDGVEGVASLPAQRLSAVSHDLPVRERGGRAARASRLCKLEVGNPNSHSFQGGEEQTPLRVAAI